jgi:hypothetical protein
VDVGRLSYTSATAKCGDVFVEGDVPADKVVVKRSRKDRRSTNGVDFRFG